MSYNHWEDADPAPGALTATMVAPMAFDIAAMQRLYGANTTANGGNNVYVLPDPGAGPTWRSIWDTGGIDEIVYNGAANAVIDLRPATLDDTPTGGGVPSYTFTTNPDSTRNYGHGFTIAGDYTNVLADQDGVAGVIIENASGGPATTTSPATTPTTSCAAMPATTRCTASAATIRSTAAAAPTRCWAAPATTPTASTASMMS